MQKNKKYDKIQIDRYRFITIKKGGYMKNIKSEETRRCLNCGTVLSNDEEYCQNCGTKYGEVKKIICTNCGNEVEFGKKYCGKCGEKTEVKVKEKINFAKNTFLKKEIWKKLIIMLILLVLLIGLIKGVTEIYKSLTISIDELITQERYGEAYKKGSEEEKNKVIIYMLGKGYFEEAYYLSNDRNIVEVNMLAYYCNEISQKLKDPSSFSCREIWYDKDKKEIVFSINGKNSYGGIVIGYWYYTYENNSNKYVLYTTVSNLDRENIYSFDSNSEVLEKTLNNLAKIKIKNIIQDESKKIDSKYIDSINQMFNNDILKNIELPNYVENNIDNESNNT